MRRVFAIALVMLATFSFAAVSQADCPWDCDRDQGCVPAAPYGLYADCTTVQNCMSCPPNGQCCANTCRTTDCYWI